MGINVSASSLSSGATLQVGGDISLQNGVAINEFSNNSNLGSAADTVVPTAAAVKAFVEGKGYLTSGDNLGNHTVTQNLNLGSYKLVGNGGSQGISIASDGKISLNNGVAVNELSTDALLGGANPSDITLVTEKAVKTYFDTNKGVLDWGKGNVSGSTSNFNNIDTSGTSGAGHNTAMGSYSMSRLTTGSSNTSYGSAALGNITTASSNTAIGGQTLLSNISGNHNIAIGIWTLSGGLTTQNYNVAIGNYAGRDLTGNYSTALGFSAGRFISGDYVTAIGGFAGQNSKTNRSVYLGYQAGYYDTLNVAHQNLYIENSATLVPLIGGSFSHNKVGINMRIDSLKAGKATLQIGGDIALENGVAVNEFSTDGTLGGNSDLVIPTEKAVKAYVQNASINGLLGLVENNDNVHGNSGNLINLTTGDHNTAIGRNASRQVTTGGHNTVVGSHAMRLATTATSNTGVGFEAFSSLKTGNSNTAVGVYALGVLDAGSENTAMGYGALGGAGSADMNKSIGLGSKAGESVTGTRSIYIGTNAGYLNSVDDALFIENSSSLTPLIGGSFSGNRVGVNRAISDLSAGATLQVGGDASKNTAGDWIANSDYRLKKNINYLNSEDVLNKLLQMKGVTYNWNDTVTGTPRPETVQYGFIAQDIQQVWPDNISEDGQGYLMTPYGTYDAVYVESIKALYERITELEKENKELHSLRKEDRKTLKDEIMAELRAELENRNGKAFIANKSLVK